MTSNNEVLKKEKSDREIFYDDEKMPCCGKEIKFFKGPEGACSENIKCAHCGAKWNICPPWFIERIG